ncbi:hypothetical protein [Pseudomonas sp. NFACC05-1]|uniref:hypothetical protein n=1 Tax=Pseudomonas sp. NFACC05-1 TaxID=1566241 RepID=UPI00087139FA|nr:hypothetical protein [Pseudomonas sp. NFACC05-1]SCW97517.1 hypothetical protein SAMN03159424_05709 [Pseudomonas sp. NFACC05-1]
MFDQWLLQRYMPGNRILKLLNDDGFYFRRVDGYPDDLTEGDREFFGRNESLILESINSRLFNDNHMSLDEAKRLSKGIVHRDKQHSFIQSWFWHDKMSRFMWNEYGKFNESSNCALIVVNRIKLGSYLDRILPVGCRSGPVKYVEDKLQHREAFFTKGLAYDIEHEYRILIDVGELIFYNKKILPDFNWPPRDMELYCEDDVAENFPNRGVACEDHFRYVDEYGFVLKAPLVELLEAILIPVSASVEFCAQLNDLLASKGCPIQCQRVEVPLE